MEEKDQITNAAERTINSTNPESWSLRRFFSFKGRIGRMEYFLTTLSIYLLMRLCINYPIAMLMLLILAIYSILAQGAKRCHDIGMSGWYQIIPLFGFVLLFKKGDTEINPYGNPLL